MLLVDIFYNVIKLVARRIFNRRTICIITYNFLGGGLEYRINTIVENFEYKYDFILATYTDPSNMKTPPSNYFKKVINIADVEKYINEIDGFDVHPWIDEHLKNFLSKTKKPKIFTLHGQYSVDSFNDAISYDKIISVSDYISKNFVMTYPEYTSKIKFVGNIINKKIRNANRSSKNILFIVTNDSDETIDCMRRLVTFIPEEYQIHVIGRIQDLKMSNRNIYYEGWCDVDSYLQEHDFLAGFSKGGFCCLELILHGIPAFSFYRREEKRREEKRNYWDSLSVVDKNNFETMFRNNFVSYEYLQESLIPETLEKIKKDPTHYNVRKLLSKKKSWPDYYADVFTNLNNRQSANL